MTRNVAAKTTEKSETTKRKALPKAKPEAEPEISENSDPEEVVQEQEQEQPQEDPITTMHNGIIEMCSMMSKLAQRITQDTKKAEREYQLEKKRMEKAISKKGGKEKKKRNGSTGLDKQLRVKTQEFRQFVEKNYQQLNDKDGNQVITELSYADDGSLQISRKKALQFVTAYVKHNDLQQYDDKKRIKMDKTLQKLFPNNAEQKEKGKVTKEENFSFVSIMGALSPHLSSSADAAEE